MSRQLRRLGLSHNAEIFIDTNTKTEFPFSDNVILLDKVLVHAINICVLNQKTPSFKNPPPYLKLMEGYLTLSGYNNEQYNKRLPLAFFQKKTISWIGSSTDVVFIKPKLISIRNSVLEFPSIGSWAGFPADGYGVTFTFFYDKYDPAIHQVNAWGELINDTNV